jgi:hypothetical protein
MVALQGQLYGDPDFDVLRITAGSVFGLPSPGNTTLTQLPNGNFQVDSFFDITYRIEFQGAPGGQLDGLNGTTQGSITMSTGDGIPQLLPGLSAPMWLLLGGLMLGVGAMLLRRRPLA